MEQVLKSPLVLKQKRIFWRLFRVSYLCNNSYGDRNSDSPLKLGIMCDEHGTPEQNVQDLRNRTFCFADDSKNRTKLKTTREMKIVGCASKACMVLMLSDLYFRKWEQKPKKREMSPQMKLCFCHWFSIHDKGKKGWKCNENHWNPLSLIPNHLSSFLFLHCDKHTSQC